MTRSPEQPTTAGLIEARLDFTGLSDEQRLWRSGGFALRAGCGERSFWIFADAGAGGGIALRSASTAAGTLRLAHSETAQTPRPRDIRTRLRSRGAPRRAGDRTAQRGDAASSARPSSGRYAI